LSFTISFAVDFARRYSKLLPGPFGDESTSLALAILSSASKDSKTVIDTLTEHDRSRLEAYSRNLVDHHLVTDLLPRLAELYFFTSESQRTTLSALQQALLVGLGLQMKSVDKLSIELNLPVQQILAMLNKAIRKLAKTSTSANGSEPAEDLESAIKHLEGREIKPGTVVSIAGSTISNGDKREDEGGKKQMRVSRSGNSERADSSKSFARRSDKKHKRG
jgi:hypothetical protein